MNKVFSPKGVQFRQVLLVLIRFLLYLDCPFKVNVQSYLPAAVKHMVKCEMPQNCFGLDCCIDLKFKLPAALGGREISYNIPFWFKMSPCDFSIDVGFGTWTYKTVLFSYAWGKINTVKL